MRWSLGTEPRALLDKLDVPIGWYLIFMNDNT